MSDTARQDRRNSTQPDVSDVRAQPRRALGQSRGSGEREQPGLIWAACGEGRARPSFSSSPSSPESPYRRILLNRVLRYPLSAVAVRSRAALRPGSDRIITFSTRSVASATASLRVSRGERSSAKRDPLPHPRSRRGRGRAGRRRSGCPPRTGSSSGKRCSRALAHVARPSSYWQRAAAPPGRSTGRPGRTRGWAVRGSGSIRRGRSTPPLAQRGQMCG